MNTPRRSLSVEWRLRNAAGDDIPFQLHPGESLSIGRDLSADISVLHAGVARHHAILELDGDDLWLEDLHSQGGTTVNGEAIRRTRVEAGDILTFGGASFTLTSRPPSDGKTDPCRKLSRERLLSLLRLSREIGAGGERGLLFGTIVQAAVEELGAEHGIILLRDPGKRAFLPVAAHPASLLATALRILPPGAAERISLGPGARAIPPAGLGAPLGGCAGRPDGILYVGRGDRTFEPVDEEALSAIAWVASPAVETAARLEAMRAWNSRLEGALGSRSRGEDRRGGATIEREGAGASILRLVKDHLSREAAELGAPDCAAASAGLGDAAVLMAAAMRLLERKSARLEEIQIGQVLAEAFDVGPGAHAGTAALSVVRGGDLPLLCAPCDLADALRLAMSLLVPPSVRRDAKYSVKGDATPDGQWIDLELSASLENDAVEEWAGSPEGHQVLRRLVAERLGGSVEWRPENAALRVRLPNLAAESRETRLLAELARRGAASA